MAKNKLPKIIVIIGPTASGKSDLGIRIAKKLHGEVISADSRQVYRGMDIGTGKVQKDPASSKHNFYSEGIRHHLIDVADPRKQFSASNFYRLGSEAITDIINKNKIPVIVGGTGFYIDILLGRMLAAGVKPDRKLRAKLEKQSAEQLFSRLTKLDPLRAESIDRYNKRRIIRAIEIRLKTGKSSAKPTYVIPDNNYDILWLGINPGKEKLAQNIKIRLEKRLGQGMIKEVRRLHSPPTGGSLSWKKMNDFGLEYRWISRYLREVQNSKLQVRSFKNSEYYEILLKEIIKYSKRQMTWFKRNKEIHWINPSVGGFKTAENLVRKFMS